MCFSPTKVPKVDIMAAIITDCSQYRYAAPQLDWLRPSLNEKKKEYVNLKFWNANRKLCVGVL